MSRYTTFARSLVKTAAVLGSIALAAETSTAPALAGSGPFQVLYIFPGVTDNGGGVDSGVATAVHCFSFSPVQETIQYVVRNNGGTVKVKYELRHQLIQYSNGSNSPNCSLHCRCEPQYHRNNPGSNRHYCDELEHSMHG